MELSEKVADKLESLTLVVKLVSEIEREQSIYDVEEWTIMTEVWFDYYYY